MAEPLVARAKPCLVTLGRKGRSYAWCACGRSATQPFCDGSHKGTGIEPVVFRARADGEEVLLCCCKRTRTPPYCDGSHNALSDSYAEASEDERRATADIPLTPQVGGKALLDGGAFVRTPDTATADEAGGWRILPIVTSADGAGLLSLYRLEAGRKATAPLGFGDGETVLFVAAGHGTVTIADRPFPVAPESGLHVRAGESIRAAADGDPMVLFATVSGSGTEPRPGVGGGAFDGTVPDRVHGVDPALRQAMADRFYQVLVGPETGAREITLFIGEIPRSRAAPHHHLYEETILILSGEGQMWTEGARAAVRPGDVIFLPRKQLHSLECTDPAGMRLAGSFCPAGSPAINY
ncbi:MAG: cupin domain-containing protein [Alphaproteobacteria bacterium]|nr:MAG: cupin domain-containing protein [Alphaproteobacteria bacterium]